MRRRHRPARRTGQVFDVPVDHLHAVPAHPLDAKFEADLSNTAFVSADVGNVSGPDVRLVLGGEICNQSRRKSVSEAQAMHIIGDVKGKTSSWSMTITTAGTICEAVKIVREHAHSTSTSPPPTPSSPLAMERLKDRPSPAGRHRHHPHRQIALIRSKTDCSS
jgi:phosphoribosylpyrophosphate synthetase